MKSLLILLLIPCLIHGQVRDISRYTIQQPTFKAYIPSASLIFLSGLSDGVRDAALFHMSGKGHWWNGQTSWNNKYKNGDITQGEAFIGSSNVFVGVSDAPHAFNTLTHEATGLALAYMPADNNNKIRHKVLQLLAYNLIRDIGHYISYDLILKPRK